MNTPLQILTYGFVLLTLLLGIPDVVLASGDGHALLDLTTSSVGYLALGVFILAYALVMAEEYTHLRKSKPCFVSCWPYLAYDRNGLSRRRFTCRRTSSPT